MNVLARRVALTFCTASFYTASLCTALCGLALTAPAAAQPLDKKLLKEGADFLAEDALRTGDAVQGAMLYYHSSLTCIACHGEGEHAQSVGPDLAKIKPETTGAALAESVLLPSKVITPGYEMVSVETNDGVLVQGILVKDADGVLVLRDAAQHEKLITIKHSDIEERHVSDQSLMPTGQVNAMENRQEFLDLLRFLMELRDGGAARRQELKQAVELAGDDFPLKPTAHQPVVHRGEIGIKSGARIPRGIALGFEGGTILFDADQLRAVAAWQDGFIKTVQQNYFGFNWLSGEAPSSLDPHLLAVKMPGADWQEPEILGATDPQDEARFDGYQVGREWVRMRYHLRIGGSRVDVMEDARAETRGEGLLVSRVFRFQNLPAGARVALTLPAEGAEHYGADGKKIAAPQDALQAPLLKYKTAAGEEIARVACESAATWEGGGASESKRWRLSAAAGKPGETLKYQLDVWKPQDAKKSPTPQALADLAAHPPVVAEAFDAPPATTVTHWQEQLSKEEQKAAPLRPAINSKMNVDDFAPTPGKYLRFNIMSTIDSEGPGIDELEIYGADPTVNLAREGKASASSVISGYAIHQIRHLNDGKYGNEHSWISGKNNRGWVQIELPKSVAMQRVVWGRDRDGVCQDRVAMLYRIEISDDGKHWTSVADQRGRATPLTNDGDKKIASLPGYEMESILLPFAGCRPSDIVFDGEGGMYLLAMTEGQVWRANVPPLDDPGHVHWQRYATGLHQPIGLAFVGRRLFVSQKPEITELIDRDQDGVVDHYCTLATGWGLSVGWHEYCFGLCADKQKNLWFNLNTGYFWTNPGYVNPGRWRGSIMRVSTETERLEVIAKGCRVPNGVALGPDDGIFFTDNQGDWIQSCKLAQVLPGRFFGHPEYKEDALPEGKYPDGRSAVWFPYKYMKSVSGPVCDLTGGKFGPFANQIFAGDVGYGGNAGLMRVALEKVDGEYQGACFRFIEAQPIGCERMKFGPDNSLYLVSLTSGLQRIRYVGEEAPFVVESVHIRPQGKGFVAQFTQPVSDKKKIDPAKIHVRRYHYIYAGKYGSPEDEETEVPVEAAELSGDRCSLTLTLPVETYPIGMVYEVTLPGLKDDAGAELSQKVFWYTVNRIPQ